MVWFDEKNIGLSKKEYDICVVKLFFPVDEILISLHREWSMHILHGDKWNATQWVPSFLQNVYGSSDFIEPEHIFSIPKNCLVNNIQGVIDRVEPKWIKKITELK